MFFFPLVAVLLSLGAARAAAPVELSATPAAMARALSMGMRAQPWPLHAAVDADGAAMGISVRHMLGALDVDGARAVVTEADLGVTVSASASTGLASLRVTVRALVVEVHTDAYDLSAPSIGLACAGADVDAVVRARVQGSFKVTLAPAAAGGHAGLEPAVTARGASVEDIRISSTSCPTLSAVSSVLGGVVPGSKVAAAVAAHIQQVRIPTMCVFFFFFFFLYYDFVILTILGSTASLTTPFGGMCRMCCVLFFIIIYCLSLHPL
jgi:hypothetical protein